ncbi:hypothetical protein D3C87_624610 [compost metagenome]
MLDKDDQFKQVLVECRKNYVDTKKLIRNYIGREVRINNPELDLPDWINTYIVEEIDVSENCVSLTWLDEEAEDEDDDRILEIITIAEFVQNAQFV